MTPILASIENDWDLWALVASFISTLLFATWKASRLVSAVESMQATINQIVTKQRRTSSRLSKLATRVARLEDQQEKKDFEI